MRSDVRLRADMPGNQFVTDPEINEYLNQSIAELYDLLVQSRGQEYYVKGVLFSTVAGQEYYTLPADHYETLYLELNNNGSRQRLGSYSLHERASLIRNSGPATTSSPTQGGSYDIVAENLGAFPQSNLLHFGGRLYYIGPPSLGSGDVITARSEVDASYLGESPAVTGTGNSGFTYVSAISSTNQLIAMMNQSIRLYTAAATPSLVQTYTLPAYPSADYVSGTVIESNTGLAYFSIKNATFPENPRLIAFDPLAGATITATHTIQQLATTGELNILGVRPGYILVAFDNELREYPANLSTFTTIYTMPGPSGSANWGMATWEPTTNQWFAVSAATAPGPSAPAFLAINPTTLAVVDVLPSLAGIAGYVTSPITGIYPTIDQTTGHVLCSSINFASAGSVVFKNDVLVLINPSTYAANVIAQLPGAGGQVVLSTNNRIYWARYGGIFGASFGGFSLTVWEPGTSGQTAGTIINPADSTPVAFRLQGSQMSLLPVADGPYQVQHFYTPACARLVNDSDSFDGIDGWEEYAIWRAVAYVRQKEDLDISVAAGIMDRLRKRIEGLAPFRAQQNTERVTDVYAGYLYADDPSLYLPRP